jgi:beta-glucosidase
MRVMRVGAVVAALCGMLLLAVVGGAGAAAASGSSPSCPWMNTSLSAATRASELLAAMTLGDKLQMVTGEYDGATSSASTSSDNPNPGAASYITANPALCIPALVMNDSINGIGDEQTGTTAFPDSITLASAWDPTLSYQYGQVLADEALAKGVNVVLGPGVDIARNPLNGRNFEYAGEDPFLTGQAAAAVIRGVQSQHVIATVKHYALNDQETDRMTDSSDASVRTMQEIDLPAFDMAVKAGVGSVMCSYNRINSVYACQNQYALNTVLDKQFGFGGFVMSDWGATHSTVVSAKAGLDMEMPSQTYYGSVLQTAVEHNQVPIATVNEMVYRILYSMFRLGLFDHVPNEGAQAAATTATDATSISMATKIAQDGTVLLKDSGGVLPLSGTGEKIAVIGPAASQPGATLAEAGYGSGHVPELSYQPGVVSPLQAITARASTSDDVVSYADGTATEDAVALAQASNVAIVFVSDAEIEGADRPSLDAQAGTCSFFDLASSTSCSYLPVNQNALVSAVAAANPHTIVVLQNGDPVAMPWINQVQGVVESWYPGQVDGDAIAPILFGDVDPSGKLPLTFPVSVSQDPLQSKAQYPGVMKPGDSVGPHSTYSEGLLIGYRWYEAKHITPLFPFGFGLSYTSFKFSHLKVTSKGETATATFRLTNTGGRYGADVAQAYVGMPASTGEPPRQLKGFQKVWLEPDQSSTVSIPLPATSFIHWSTKAGTWVITAGTYHLYVGDSSASLPLQAKLHRKAARLAPGVY